MYSMTQQFHLIALYKHSHVYKSHEYEQTFYHTSEFKKWREGCLKYKEWLNN